MNLFSRLSRALILSGLALFGAGVPSATASHFAKVDILVDFIGADSTQLKYRVVLQVYKACEGVGSGQADLSTASENITVSSTSAQWQLHRAFPIFNLHDTSNLPGHPMQFPMSPVNPFVPILPYSNGSGQPGHHGPLDTMDQYCASITPLNLCRQPFSPTGFNYPAFVRATYVDTITVPARATDWKFTWESSARNSSVLNLTPNQSCIHNEAMINNLEPGRWNNSSPRYLVPPIHYINTNWLYQIVNAPYELATDNADSMVTVNHIPQGCGAVPLGYQGVYAANPPINSAIPYQVNPATGTVFVKPMSSGNHVVAFRTYEYDRNSGALMGYVSRDLQFAVMPSGNAVLPLIHLPPVQLSGGTLLADSIVSVPANQTVSFDVTAKVAGLGSVVRFYADNSYSAPGSQFTVTYPSSDSAVGHFTWTPAPAQVDSYLVTLVAIDSTCNPNEPIVAYAYRNLILKVTPPTGIGAVVNQAGIRVWPNPAGKTLHLSGATIDRAEVLSLTGQTVGAYNRPSGGMDISHLAPGMYLIRMTSGPATVVARFVKE